MGEADDATATLIENASIDHIAALIEAREYQGFFAVHEGDVAAGGGVWLRPLLPPPDSPRGGHEAYLLNVFVEQHHRGCGIARAPMTWMIEWCAHLRFARVALHASADGRPLYAILGFTGTNEMNSNARSARRPKTDLYDPGVHSYRSIGLIPRKRHVVLRRGTGESATQPGTRSAATIHYEELIGNRGFTGPSSLLYRLRIPTAVRSVERIGAVAPEAEQPGALRNRHFETSKIACGRTTTLGRVPLLFNSDVRISLARPVESEGGFYRNGQADETLYIAEGAGVVQSAFGDVRYRAGDYVVIPRGITHRVVIDPKVQPQRYLMIESAGYVRAPKRYRGDHGQLLEGAPYSERDFRGPENLRTHDETGEYEVIVKQNDALTRVVVPNHPFDAVGWDGIYYPVAFSIHDFEPKVGRVHLPPPVHQTFEAEGLVICSFCPRPYDFHPDAVPAPYSHSNAMSDEVLFYASAEFMSRKGISFGSITLHPDGLPHGPQPGRTEASLRAKWTDELAVMIDTFRPLQVAKGALDGEDPSYARSWVAI